MDKKNHMYPAERFGLPSPNSLFINPIFFRVFLCLLPLFISFSAQGARLFRKQSGTVTLTGTSTTVTILPITLNKSFLVFSVASFTDNTTVSSGLTNFVAASTIQNASITASLTGSGVFGSGNFGVQASSNASNQNLGNQQVQSIPFTHVTEPYGIDIINQPSGVYIIKAITNQQVRFYRIIKL